MKTSITMNVAVIIWKMLLLPSTHFLFFLSLSLSLCLLSPFFLFCNKYNNVSEYINEVPYVWLIRNRVTHTYGNIILFCLSHTYTHRHTHTHRRAYQHTAKRIHSLCCAREKIRLHMMYTIISSIWYNWHGFMEKNVLLYYRRFTNATKAPLSSKLSTALSYAYKNKKKTKTNHLSSDQSQVLNVPNICGK